MAFVPQLLNQKHETANQRLQRLTL